MLELLILPDIVLEKILSYLTYDDIAKYRIVSLYRLHSLWNFIPRFVPCVKITLIGVVTESAVTIQ